MRAAIQSLYGMSPLGWASTCAAKRSTSPGAQVELPRLQHLCAGALIMLQSG